VAIAALVTAALLWAVGPGVDAADAAPAHGTLTIVPGGQAADAFGIGAVDPARRGRATVAFPVAGLSVGRPARATVRGGLRLRAGGQAKTLRALRAVVRADRLALSARLAGKRRTFFAAALPARRLQLDRAAGRLSLSRTPLALTRAGARVLRAALGVKRVAAGAFGRVGLAAAVKRSGPTPGPTPPQVDPPSNPPADPPVDPYAFCPVAAGAAPGTPEQPGAPAAGPALSSPQAIAGGSVDWGFRSSFRNYVSGGNGNPPIGTQGGAAINPDGSFAFPIDAGQIEAGSEPRAIFEGKGSAVFCYPSHFFRIAMLNPTVTIDGPQSRLTIDVASNVSGTEYGPWRSDLAALDVSAVEPEYSNDGQTVTWSDVPATLTADGAAAFVGFYAAGEALDPLTVTAGEPLTGPLTSVVSRADAVLDPAQSVGDLESEGVTVSANGRYVAFGSYAANLVPGDTFNTPDVFRRDLLTRRTTRVNVDDAGVAVSGTDIGSSPQVSADGRHVAFVSDAALEAADVNGVNDVYVRDVVAGTTTLVSVATDASAGGGLSGVPSISADGSRVGFFSDAANLIAGDGNGVRDLFVRDLAAETTTRASVADNEAETVAAVTAAGGISGDGGHAVFVSNEATLAAGDSGSFRDAFVRDLDAETTTLVSLGDDESPTGAHVDLSTTSAAGPKISADGNRVVFYSTAANLVAGDGNGVRDCFVRDLAAQTTRRVNASATGAESAVACGNNPTISADGSTVAFSSEASDLVAGDANGVADVFFRALADPATIQRANVATDGTEAGVESTGTIALDGDGGRVAFKSGASDLTGNPAFAAQVLVRELP
jgi:Tol biopolymer transport system component